MSDEQRIEKYAREIAAYEGPVDWWRSYETNARGVIEIADAEQAQLRLQNEVGLGMIQALTDERMAARATIARLHALVDGHAFTVEEWDTGVKKCPHPSHLSGYSPSCPQAWLAEQLKEQS